MRSQWCREHIDEAAEKCGLGKDTVSDVKKAAAFCVDHEDMSNCSTRAIMALIDIRDDPVREKAISSISKAFDSNKHPVTGQILKDKKLTEREIKKVIEKAEMEVRGELSKKYAEDRKNNPPSKPEEKKDPPKKEAPPVAQPDPAPVILQEKPPLPEKTDKMLFMEACDNAFKYGNPEFKQSISELLEYHPSWKTPGGVIFFCVTNPKEAIAISRK